MEAIEVVEEVEVEVGHPTRHLHLVVPIKPTEGNSLLERMYVQTVYKEANGPEIAKSLIWLRLLVWWD